MLDQDYKHLKRILITSQKADPAPPLGTVLGNLGVNTTAFCKEFNAFTKDLPDYFLLKVFIKIYDNRSTKFSVKLPTTGYILNLLKIEQDITKKVYDRLHVYKVWCIKLKDVIKIALLKFPNVALEKSLPMIFGSVKSKGLKIIK